MDNPTYRELLKKLLELPPERLDDNITIHDVDLDDFYPASLVWNTTEDNTLDILDEGHLVISYQR